ncbi:hypothetical protein Trco_002961 [Trichoderma cornu-damae]|uniref:Zn(2)-C6 fungal-type domain-containing protein n=1 Tax=Trichoderma cornu-damae TaxID=654480 RepID=A0A9P8QTT8_9HYPO|nr:hypothetical protein Trco_002961 [Trichoderma cornu-damae]
MSDSAPQRRWACIPCTKAKRKCSKQTPSCRRCLEKKAVCRYPAPRITPPYDLVFSQDGAVSVIPTPLSDDGNPLLPAPPSQVGGQQQIQQHQQIHAGPSHPAAGTLLNPWFLSPASWTIDHKTEPLSSHICFVDETLTYFIDKLHLWLKQWTSKGHCPFIHPQLWRVHLPDCIQDAFTSLAAYHSKTPATERTVLRIVENRVNSLVEGQNASSAGDFGFVMLDPAYHLARTQALLIYKVICLFNGDVRARAQAEKHIDTLDLWAQQMWQSASLALSSDHDKAPLDRVSNGPVDTQLRTDGSLTSTWQAWIFSESIRRTYLTATLTEAVYLTLKQGWAPCPGNIMFSGGEGLWEAPSPISWMTCLQENLINTIRGVDAEQLFSHAKTSDVDEFCHAILIAKYGLERYDRWLNEKT